MKNNSSHTTQGTKLMVQQVTSCSLMAAPNMASSYFIPITIKIRAVPWNSQKLNSEFPLTHGVNIPQMLGPNENYIVW